MKLNKHKDKRKFKLPIKTKSIKRTNVQRYKKEEDNKPDGKKTVVS